MTAESLPRAVSVVIPARNEEANIARCVRSVAAQDGVREIIVVDDQSTDRTPAILEELRAGLPALQVVRLDSVPAGWTGKTFALAAGAQRATGDWLLFTDADTHHLPGSLAACLARAGRERADLFSLSPAQLTLTWWERAVIPLVYTRLARLFRFEDVSNPRSPVAAANGQYILIRRSLYEKIGGHRAVATELLEDVALARRAKSAGAQLYFMPGAGLVETRMYRALGGMWAGWKKNLYLLYGASLPKTLGAAAAILLAVLLPILLAMVLLGLAFAGRGGGWVVPAASFLVAYIFGRATLYSLRLREIGFDPALAGSYFLGAPLFALLLVASAWAHRGRGRVEWKGRSYPVQGGTTG